MKGLNDLRSCCFGAIAAALLLGGTAPALAQQAMPNDDLDAIIDTANDPEAALRLAREQSDSDDLIGAAATLERALLARPGAATTRLRLYYVATLCRLDDRTRAQIELAKVDAARIDDGDWAIAVQACGAIDRPTATAAAASALVGQIAIGFAYDTDALGALSVAFDFPGITGVSDDDFSFIAAGRIDGRVALGQSYLYGGIAGQTKNALGNSLLDYQIGSVRAGYGRQGNRVGFSFGGVVEHARLQGAPFVTEYGGQAEATLATGRTGRFALRGEGVHQGYTGSFPFFSRDGTRYDLALDYSATTRNQAHWVIGAAFEDKSADTAYLGYRGARLYSAFRQPIGHAGSYATVSSTIRFVDFRDAPFVTDRRETRFFTRAALGLPVFGNGFGLEAGVSHTRRDYNASSFLRDYDSFGFDLQLVWNFGQ
ncbi:hypothetical protein [Sphingomonas sp. 28-63-12]|uniref:hypothetical protein n=1 Tax=Sphingomonas sp. 28-63-12 TaxID=1970434 RepID=UPI000BC3BCB7|nr:MAG: hypothetical protein B7Y47_14355 [Sphingomonas sp. 28-63-12]